MAGNLVGRLGRMARSDGPVTLFNRVCRRVMRVFDPHFIAHRSLRRVLSQRSGYSVGRLLDVGCGTKPYQSLFPNVREYIGIEMVPHAAVDVIASALALPFRNHVFDTVLCTQVLEHVPEPARLLDEVYRVLKPGGYLLLTTPQTWGLHHEPYDYFRYTPYGLRHLAQQAGFEVLDVQPTCGLWATGMQRLADVLVFTYARRTGVFVQMVLSMVLFPLLVLGAAVDGVVGLRGDTLDNVLVAQRTGMGNDGEGPPHADRRQNGGAEA